MGKLCCSFFSEKDVMVSMSMSSADMHIWQIPLCDMCHVCSMMIMRSRRPASPHTRETLLASSHISAASISPFKRYTFSIHFIHAMVLSSFFLPSPTQSSMSDPAGSWKYTYQRCIDCCIIKPQDQHSRQRKSGEVLRYFATQDEPIFLPRAS